MNSIIYTLLLLSGAILSCTLIALATHEGTRLFECANRCSIKNLENENLLNSTVCKGNKYGKEASKACEIAQEENEIHHYSCVARLYWKEGGVYHLYSMFAESYVMLFGLSAFSIYVTFHFLFAKWQHDKLVSVYKDTMQSLQQQQPVFNFTLPEKRQKLHGNNSSKRDRHYVDWDD